MEPLKPFLTGWDGKDPGPPDTLYAWVTESRDGQASMIGTITEYGNTPLVTVRDKLALGPLRELALEHHRITGQKCWLVRYRSDGVVETHG